MSALAGSYDPEARRDTPLARKLIARIRAEGPITVAQYMQACLHDGEHGYYRSRSAIGRDGDFVTAPEISQIFGELIGLWCAVVWQQMGSPKAFHLIEIGPGRGTLMADALRATRIVSGFGSAAQIALVETNPHLIAEQRAGLAPHAASITWHEYVTQLPGGPAVVVGNEVLDVVPSDQFVFDGVGFVERMVGLDDRSRLAFVTSRERPMLLRPGLDPPPVAGAVIERRQTMEQTFALDRLARTGPLAAVFIDYGHESLAIGDTLQAVRSHAYDHPLASPGEADLTQQVDFTAFGREASSWGLAIDGPTTQAEFLGRLGIAERASRLMAANPAKAGEIEAGVARLMAPNGMGTRFKAIGIRSVHLPPLPGF